MEMQRKQLIIFIPFEYRSYGEIGKDCVANGRKLFAEIKNSFSSKRKVKFRKHIITDALLVSVSDTNRLKDVKIDKDSIIIVHAFNDKTGEYLKDKNRGEIAAKKVIDLLEVLVKDTGKIAEYHFATCYSTYMGSIARAWKNRYPETTVYGKKGRFTENSTLFKRKKNHIRIHTTTNTEILKEEENSS